MPSETMRFSATTPEGKTLHKQLSLNRYTKEEAMKLGQKWIQDIKAGKDYKKLGRMPKVGEKSKKDPDSDSDSDSTSSDESSSGATFDLPRKQFTTITLPDEGGASALFLGSTRSGKTTFIKAFHEHFFEDTITILHTCSPSASTYSDLKKKVALAPEFCPEIIDECMKLNQKVKNKYRFTHIIDDCVSSKNDKTMVKLLTIGRNSFQNCLISGQELSILNAIGRSNINFVFLGKLNSSMAIEKVVKQYLQSIFPSHLKLADKIKLYSKLTENYNWIVIDCISGRAFISKLNI